jgi:RNA polymerase sigma-70 factor, ECF subfamily
MSELLDEPLVLDKADEIEARVATPLAAASPRALAPLGEWVVLVAARDETAMRQLYRAVAAHVHRVVVRIVSDPHLADEVVSECLWQVWREAAHFDVTRGSVATWVAMIARSRALDALRRRKLLATHEEPLLDGHEESLASPDGSPCAHLETRQRKRSLDTALARIDPMQRQMLTLSFTGGLSHEQVAAHCGMALGTVKSHIRRGIAQMHRHCVRAGLQP